MTEKLEKAHDKRVKTLKQKTEAMHQKYEMRLKMVGERRKSQEQQKETLKTKF